MAGKYLRGAGRCRQTGGTLTPAALQRLWIAAQAIENGYALLTLHAADFVGLPGLRLLTLRG
ncbi:MAG: hypothetical protein KGZ43_01040 [Sulfuritalea sp.]|nr:hypothetical protein [Sulfuritalea sp.]